ncbi:MAG: hypothetical protein ACI90V_009925, partial [Bacillariaceae sp.]
RLGYPCLTLRYSQYENKLAKKKVESQIKNIRTTVVY